MERLHRTHAFAFDSHFEQFGTVIRVPNAIARVIFCTLIPGALCAYLLQHGRLGAKTHLASAFRLAQKEPEIDRQVVRDALIRGIRKWAKITPHLY